jgi:hypothetical protein
MGFREWAWRTLTERGRAWTAYERGDLKWQTTLPVHKPGYRATLKEIEEVGWRQVERVDHPPVRRTDVTPRSDGGHDVAKTVTQDATFYFIRDEQSEDDDSWEPQAAAAPTQADSGFASAMPPRRPPPGWYPTSQGFRWWDGTQWGSRHHAQPFPPPLVYAAAPRGMTPAEHVLHLVLTFFTAGIWAPVWIFLAWRKRNRAGV